MPHEENTGKSPAAEPRERMTPEERGNWFYLLVAVGAYAAYLITVLSQLATTAPADIDFATPLLWSIGVAIALSIVGRILFDIAGEIASEVGAAVRAEVAAKIAESKGVSPEKREAAGKPSRARKPDVRREGSRHQPVRRVRRRSRSWYSG